MCFGLKTFLIPWLGIEPPPEKSRRPNGAEPNANEGGNFFLEGLKISVTVFWVLDMHSSRQPCNPL